MFNTIEELEKELERFHNNIVNSSKLIETLQSIIEAINSEKQELGSRTEALQELITSLPETVESNNKTIIAEYCKNVLEAIQKEHGLYVSSIEKYILSLENTSESIVNSQSKHLTGLQLFASTFSSECKAYKQDFESRMEALYELIASLPETVESNNKTIIAEYCKNVLEAIQKEHGLYVSSIEKYILSLESTRESLISSQTQYLTGLQLIASTFSSECQSYKNELLKTGEQISQTNSDTLKAISLENIQTQEKLVAQIRALNEKMQEFFSSRMETFSADCNSYITGLEKIKTDVISETSSAINLITNENKKIHENYLDQVKVLNNEIASQIEGYLAKIENSTNKLTKTEEMLHERFEVSEKKITTLLLNAETTFENISTTIREEVSRLINEINTATSTTKQSNKELAAEIEAKFIKSFQSLQTENDQLHKKLDNLEAQEKKNSLLFGAGIAITIILSILGFFI